MRQTCVIPIAIAITLCVAGVALAQPQPDPAPVPPPAQQPPPTASSSTPAEPTTPQASPPARETERSLERIARREKTAKRTYSVPAHVTRAEAVATLTQSESVIRSRAVTASAVAPATPADGFSAAAGAALILLLGSGLMALAFALIPARALGAVSGRLVERRADIGLAYALTLALGAAAFVVLVGT